jgi:hypothetical protein
VAFIQWGLGMRLVSLLALALCVFASSRANALVVSNGETVQVYGPYGTDPLGNTVTIDVEIQASVNWPPINPAAGAFVAYGYRAYASVGNALFTVDLSDCAFTIGGPCRYPWDIQHSIVLVDPTHPSFSVGTSIGYYYFDSVNGTNWPPGFDPTGTVTIIANIRNSEFTFEPQIAAIPEPSTWAMLLIGFAGMGFVSVRNRKRLGLAGALYPG